MANKTTKGRLAKYPSTALTFKLFAQGSDTVANGSGDSATTGANGGFSFVVTEALSGWYDVSAYEGSTLRGVGKVFYPGDVVGTYYVDDPDKPQVYPPLYRSADDTQDILFLWPVNSDTITATVSINGATPVAVSGAITQTALTANGQYFYELAYDADDRPTGEGTALYVFSGNGYTGYLTLEVSPSLSNLSLITPEGVVYLEGNTTNIKLKVGSTKAKTHYTEAGTSLSGKTLKLYIETKPGVFFDEISATGGAGGAFTFTPSAELAATVATYKAALREPSDGNNVLWDGLIEVGHAADAE